jgi:polyhydroxybutyrate depolymerase
MKLQGVQESVQTWVKLNGCDEQPRMDTISKDGDEMQVTRKTYGGGKDGSEVVLVLIEGGGHTWPGQPPPVGFRVGQKLEHISHTNISVFPNER